MLKYEGKGSLYSERLGIEARHREKEQGDIVMIVREKKIE